MVTEFRLAALRDGRVDPVQSEAQRSAILQVLLHGLRTGELNHSITMAYWLTANAMLELTKCVPRLEGLPACGAADRQRIEVGDQCWLQRLANSRKLPSIKDEHRVAAVVCWLGGKGCLRRKTST